MNFLSLPIAFIDSLGGSEMVVIFLIVLLLFGGDKMPEFAKGLAKSIREFKKATSGVEEEFKRAMEDPPETPKTFPSILPPAATVPQQQLESPAIEVAQIDSGISSLPEHPVPADEPLAAAPEAPTPAHPIVDTKPKVQRQPVPSDNTDWL